MIVPRINMKGIKANRLKVGRVIIWRAYMSAFLSISSPPLLIITMKGFNK